AAIDENPGQTILVKLHPEVLAGKKQGYLKDLAIKHGCTLLTGNINPWQLFNRVSTLYTVSSQLGFDALMAGCKVRCFAMPFYAGWGLTTDETTCPRRQGHTPSIAAIAGAAFNQYARYIDACEATSCDVSTTINQLALIRDTHNQNKNLAAFYQITPWKWQRIKQMFRPAAKNRTFFFSQNGAINAAIKRQGDLVAWASRIDETFERTCQSKNVKLQRLEDGFIRSVGLGTNFHLPMSLIIDDLGIYYDSTRPSRLEHILENHAFTNDELSRAAALIDNIVENEISKYNLGEVMTIEDLLPQDQKIILVPGQVDDDASIRLGGGGMTSVDLLAQVRANNSDAFIIFKIHPDVLSGQRPGLRDTAEILKFADIPAPDTPINQLIAICNEVHTISSLTGFEALLRGKQVHCYGMPFYAGWGLTNDRTTCQRRSRKLTLEMLTFATLIKYPRYYDPVSSLPCGPEQIIRRIAQQRAAPSSPSLLIRTRTAFGKLRSRLR
ncbi:MAG TPA: capsular polysaccharide biosynthesis protein, partial [Rhizobiales bacterium]|nr:capsular polysaccharide biosynthesis protein [Hyphomicrobiales bacterium]